MSNPGSTEGFGTRELVRILVEAIRVYLRHKDKIDPDLPTGVVSALETIVAALDILEALNPPGPE